jgi:hypothetical protein
LRAALAQLGGQSDAAESTTSNPSDKGSFGALPAAMKLALLRAMCNALLQTEEFMGECARRDEERFEREAAMKAEEREKKREKAAANAAVAVAATSGAGMSAEGEGATADGEEGGKAVPTAEAKAIYYTACVARVARRARARAAARARARARRSRWRRWRLRRRARCARRRRTR